MFADGGNYHASAIPPRSLNVQKFAESRASELQSLHSTIASRSNNDFRSHRNKRRRTTGHDNRVTKNRFRKKQNVAVGGGSTNDHLEKHEKKVHRRILRRAELKRNPRSGYSTSGDGTKRLRTHVWHAKRFNMTKLWGFHLPLGLQGRGRGSRALLKKVKHGVLVHDASYYGAVQLEGPEDSLESVLSTVMVPYPSSNCHQTSQNILSGATYGTAMLHRYGALFSKAIAPVTYMWRPQHTNADSRCHNVDSSGEQEIVDGCASSRQLWVWIHPAAFKEGYDVLKAACEQRNLFGCPINCISLENELAQLELIGLSSFELIQKILHPAIRISDNVSALKKCSVSGVADGGTLLEDLYALKNEDEISTSAIISLTVNDPRTFFEKETAVVSEAKPPGILGNTEIEVQGSTNFAGVCETNRDSLSSFCLKPKEGYHFSEFVDLWDAHIGIVPPVEESVLCKKKHFQRMKFYRLNEKVSETHPLEAGWSCQLCPIMLLKNNIQKGSITRWTIILPLSWVRAFWTTIVSSGACAIGLRERHWVACEMGLPYFPSDFPDSNAYSCYMAIEEAATYEKAKLRPPVMRPLRVPILLPWDSIQHAVKKKSITVGDTQIQPAIDYSIENVHCEKCNIAAVGCRATSFGVYVARTSYMLIQFLTHINGDGLLLFPCMPGTEKCLLKVMKDEEMINQRTNGISSQIKCCKKLCFVRVLLHAFSEGVFEEGAVVCAPHTADINMWTSRSEDDRGKLQVPQSLLHSYFVQQSSGEWELQVPEDPADREFYRFPIGYVTTGFVRGSKKPVAVALCEAVLLACLRGEQWKIMSSPPRRKEIYVLVRNLKSTAYRLAVASIVLEAQEEDVESF